MDEKILKLLYDIDTAILEIEDFFSNNPLDFFQYESNLLLKRATERELEIIGEAINRILKIDPDFPIKNARNIIGLRNQVIHAYDTISDENYFQTYTPFKNRNTKFNSSEIISHKFTEQKIRIIHGQ